MTTPHLHHQSSLFDILIVFQKVFFFKVNIDKHQHMCGSREGEGRGWGGTGGLDPFPGKTHSIGFYRNKQLDSTCPLGVLENNSFLLNYHWISFVK